MTATTAVAPRVPRAALATTVIWFVLAAIGGASGVLLRLPFPVPQLAILGLIVASLVATTAIPSLRAWIESLPLRTLIGVNAMRFVGIAFLVLAARGQLAEVFADRAGWGDIVAAAVALGLVVSGPPATPARRALTHLWNVFGCFDLVVAVGTATWVVVHGSKPGMEPLLSFPLCLIPLFFVPVLLVGHVFIFRRLVAEGRPAGGR